MRLRKVDAVQVGNYGNPVLRIYARGEDKKKYVVDQKGLPSYFFSKTKPTYPPDLQSKVKRIEEGYTSIFGEPLWKIYTRSPGDTNALRENLPHYEADIHWTERACIDLKLTDGFTYDNNTGCISIVDDVDDIQLRSWVLDVEISSPPNILPNHTTPQYSTVCVVVRDSYTNDYLIFRLDHYKDEEALWEDFISKIDEFDPDIITGWNIAFDISWIISRMRYLGIDYNRLSKLHWRVDYREFQGMGGFKFIKCEIPGRVIFDGLEAYKVKKNPSGQLSSYNLHAVAEKETGDKWEDFGNRIEATWKVNKQQIIDYCKKDVEVESKIITKERLIEQALTLCRLSGCTPPQTTRKEQIIDHALLLRRGDRILPSKQRFVTRKVEDKVKGAVVLVPSPGIHKKIGVFDAAALYPSIISGFNISAETKNQSGTIIIKDEEGKEYKFLDPKIKKGILPQAIEEFRELREKVRQKKYDAEAKYGHDSPQYKALEEEDTADKFIITSFYGVNGFSKFRLFDPDCANAITAVGRSIINGLAKYLGERGFPVEYGDTDSVFVQLKHLDNGDEVSKLIESFVGSQLEEMGVTGSPIKVKFEKFFEWCIFKRRKVRKGVYESVKKKYVAHMTWSEGQPTDYMYIRGFETRRSDAAPILKKTMEEFFNVMRQGDFTKAIQFLSETKKTFKDNPPFELAIPRQIHTNDPKTSNPWIDGVEYGRKHLGWQYDGQTAPGLLYLRRSPPTAATNVICIQKDHELPKDFEIDYEVMWEKTIRKKFEPLLDAMGRYWHIDIEGHKSLDQWFDN